MQKIFQLLRGERLPEALLLLLFGIVGKEDKREISFQLPERLPSPKEDAPVPQEPEKESLSPQELAALLSEWAQKPENCQLDYDMSTLSLRIGVKYECVSAYFHDNVRLSFRTWKLKMKLEAAKSLLLEREELHVVEVAHLAGFPNHANFYRQFRKHVGCTPFQWRSCRGNLHFLEQEEKSS